MGKRVIEMIEVKEFLFRWCRGLGKRAISRSLGMDKVKYFSHIC